MEKRTITGLLASAYVIAMVLLGKTALLINIALLLVVGTYEVLQSLSAGGFHPVKWVYYPYVLLLVPAYLWGGDRGLLLMLMIGAMTAMAATAIRHAPDAREMLAALLPAFYPALPIMALCLLVTSGLAHWRLFVWMAFAVSVGSDGFALFFGKAFGKRKLIPKVSPNKTVEGAVGGLVGGVFAALVMYGFSAYMGDGLPIWLFIGLGLAGSVVTQVGDIVASCIKRICGVKDFGKLFPGHGGLLDRMDGIMYNSVALCIFVLFVTAGK